MSSATVGVGESHNNNSSSTAGTTTNKPHHSSHGHQSASSSSSSSISSFWDQLYQIIGNDFEFIFKYWMAIVYITVVVGSYIIIVTISFPKARASKHVPDYHLVGAHITFVVAVTAWLYTFQANPGIITKETLHYYNHYDYDELLYERNRMDSTCGLSRILARSKYDRYKYHAYIPRFDHYCGWVGNTIGEENYRVFLGFVCTQYFLCLYTSIIFVQYALGVVEDENLRQLQLYDIVTGQEYSMTKWMIVHYLVIENRWETAILTITGTLCFMLTYFLWYHIRIASRNITTSEDYKWNHIKQWHQHQTLLYKQCQQRQQKQKQQQPPKQQQPLIVPDGDVGCTGGSATTGFSTDDEFGDKDKESDMEEAATTEAPSSLSEGEEARQQQPYMGQVVDPGPLPKHLYDKGFIENWKEVLFPISLRKKRAEQAALNKRKAT